VEAQVIDVVGQQSDWFSSSFSYTVPASALQVYRFYKKSNGSYVYTTSAATKKKLTKDTKRYRYQGVAWTVNRSNPSNDDPLFTFYNRRTKSYFYSAQPATKKFIAKYMPKTYRYDGSSYKVSMTYVEGGTPVHRFYIKKNRTYFYTTSASEVSSFKKNKKKYEYNGAVFYIAP